MKLAGMIAAETSIAQRGFAAKSENQKSKIKRQK
jgi:hypothetical protein